MRGAKPELPRHLTAVGKPFRIPQVPIEWLDAGSWRLPSGKALAEFALQAGFLAPLLFKTESFGRRPKPRTASEQLEKEGNR